MDFLVNWLIWGVAVFVAWKLLLQPAAEHWKRKITAWEIRRAMRRRGNLK